MLRLDRRDLTDAVIGSILNTEEFTFAAKIETFAGLERFSWKALSLMKNLKHI